MNPSNNARSNVNKSLSRVERMFPDFHPVMKSENEETVITNETAKKEEDNKTMIQSKPDSEYTARDVFIEDIKEKKSACPRQGASKPRKYPTQKEFEAQCKELFTIKLGKRITLAEIKKCSPDLQKMYFKDMLTRYPYLESDCLAKMLGCNYMALYNILSNIGITLHHGRVGSVAIDSRMRFMKEVLGEEIVEPFQYSDICGKKMLYEEIKKCSLDLQKMYFEDMLTRYPQLKLKSFAKMLDCSVSTVKELFSGKLGIELGKGKSNIAVESEKRFRKEILGEEIEDNVVEVVNASEEEEKTAESVSDSAKDFTIVNIDIVCDADKISSILKNIGLSGKVKVTVERI